MVKAKPVASDCGIPRADAHNPCLLATGCRGRPACPSPPGGGNGHHRAVIAAAATTQPRKCARYREKHRSPSETWPPDWMNSSLPCLVWAPRYRACKPCRNRRHSLGHNRDKVNMVGGYGILQDHGLVVQFNNRVRHCEIPTHRFGQRTPRCAFVTVHHGDRCPGRGEPRSCHRRARCRTPRRSSSSTIITHSHTT